MPLRITENKANFLACRLKAIATSRAFGVIKLVPDRREHPNYSETRPLLVKNLLQYHDTKVMTSIIVTYTVAHLIILHYLCNDDGYHALLLKPIIQVQKPGKFASPISKTNSPSFLNMKHPVTDVFNQKLPYTRY